MSQLDQYVNASEDDWSVNSSGTYYSEMTVVAQDDNVIIYTSIAYCLIDTSSIPDDATIDSATFYWYNHSYAASKGTTKHQQITIDPDSTDYTIFESTTYSDGAKSQALDATGLAEINKSGDTKFKFVVDTPPASKFRLWDIRAWDGYSGANEQCRLVVNYTEASERKRTMILR